MRGALVGFLGIVSLSCADAQRSNPDASSPDASTSSELCGTANAATKCESVTWPRLIVSFGDEGARALTYAVTTDDGLTFSDQYSPCPGGYGESTAFVCDLGYYAGTNEKTFTLHVSRADSGPALLSRDIPLTSFNYCGRGVAYVVVTTAADTAVISDVRYISVCDAL